MCTGCDPQQPACATGLATNHGTAFAEHAREACRTAVLGSLPRRVKRQEDEVTKAGRRDMWGFLLGI